MLRIEHVNLVVRDIPVSLDFYEAVMPHWKVRGEGKQTWYGVERHWVHFGDDYHYLTLNDSGTGSARDLCSNALGLAHIGLEVSDLDAVVARLARLGFEPDHFGPPLAGRRNVYFIDPDGLEVEFVEYLSDLPEERNDYEN